MLQANDEVYWNAMTSALRGYKNVNSETVENTTFLGFFDYLHKIFCQAYKGNKKKGGKTEIKIKLIYVVECITL